MKRIHTESKKANRGNFTKGNFGSQKGHKRRALRNINKKPNSTKIGAGDAYVDRTNFINTKHHNTHGAQRKDKL